MRLLASVLLLTACGLSICSLPVYAQSRQGLLIDPFQAERNGLKRAWVMQLQLDPARDRVDNIVLARGLLIVQSRRGSIQAIDAESGRLYWSVRVGNPLYPTLRPAANERYVAVTNGSTLYMLERATGTELWQGPVGASPAAGLAMDERMVYVPLGNGSIEGYPLERPNYISRRPRQYPSTGQLLAPPLTTPTSICWGTDRGYVFSFLESTDYSQFRFQTGGAVVAPLGYRPPHLFAASQDGFLYALSARSGQVAWQYSVGGPVSHPPVPAHDAVYVVPESGGLHKLAADTGLAQWRIPGIARLLAVSPTRLFAADLRGQLIILDAASGGRLGQLPTEALSLQFINTVNDRVYLGTTDGLLQCLHDAQLAEPVPVVPPPAIPSSDLKAPEETPAEPAEPATPSPFGSPFGAILPASPLNG